MGTPAVHRRERLTRCQTHGRPLTVRNPSRDPNSMDAKAASLEAGRKKVGCGCDYVARTWGNVVAIVAC